MSATQDYSMSTAKGIYKNEITQVHELATKHHWTVEFSDCREYGPAHRKNFTLSIKVGHLCAVGHGCTKKEAKASAAAVILGSLKQIPVPPNTRQAPEDDRRESLTSSADSKPTPGPQTFKEGIIPCGCLSEVVQARGIKYPEYSLLESKRLPTGWLFTMGITVNGVTVVETGPTKKAAKNSAAAKMLALLGVNCPQSNALLGQEVPASPQVNLGKEEVPVEVAVTGAAPDTTNKKTIDGELAPEPVPEATTEASVPFDTELDPVRGSAIENLSSLLPLSNSPDIIVEEEVFVDSDGDELSAYSSTQTSATPDSSNKKTKDDIPLPPSEVNPQTEPAPEPVPEATTETSVPFETELDPVKGSAIENLSSLLPLSNSPDIIVEEEVFVDSDGEDELSAYSSTQTSATPDSSNKKTKDDNPLPPSEVGPLKELVHLETGVCPPLKENGAGLEPVPEVTTETSVLCEAEEAPVGGSVIVSEVSLESPTAPDHVLCDIQIQDTPETSPPLLSEGAVTSPVETADTCVQCELAPGFDSAEVLKSLTGPENDSPVDIEIPEAEISDGAGKVSEVSSEKLMAPDHPPGSVPYREASTQPNTAEEVFGGEDRPVEEAPVLDSVDEGVLQTTLLDPETSEMQPFSQEEVQSLTENSTGTEIFSTYECIVQDTVISETPVSPESISHTEPSSSTPDLNRSLVSGFLVRTLIQKLAQKRSIECEDPLKVVDFLLQMTKEQLVINEDLEMSVKEMRTVGKKACKDLLKDPKLKDRPLRPEDHVFQEVMVQHLNERLDHLQSGQKKKKGHWFFRLFRCI